MWFADIAPGVFALLLYSTFAIATTAQSSAFFSAVQLSGQTQCSTDIPSATLTARSARQCSLSCVGLQDECCAFNYIEEEMSCELFDNVTSSNCTEMSGCTLYQVKVIKRIKASVAITR